jgi:hypothetical protein
MDKGIRSGVDFEFNRLLPQWREMGGRLPGSNFRHAVVAWAVENYEVTWSSGCTHYNHSLQAAKVSRPELCEGLGRAEDKKGGRKTNASKLAAALVAVEAATAGTAADTSEQFQEWVAAVAGAIPETVIDAAATGEVEDTAITVPQTYTVTRVKDGAVVAEGLVLAAAEAMLARAAAGKKAKLVYA